MNKLPQIPPNSKYFDDAYYDGEHQIDFELPGGSWVTLFHSEELEDNSEIELWRPIIAAVAAAEWEKESEGLTKSNFGNSSLSSVTALSNAQKWLEWGGWL